MGVKSLCYESDSDFKRLLCCRSCETKLPHQRSSSSKDGLLELAALLYSEGSVEGRGEVIEQPVNKKFHEYENISYQCDHFPACSSLQSSKQNSLEFNTFSLALAEEIRQKLETHKKLKKKRSSLKRGESFEVSGESLSPMNSSHINTSSNGVLEDPWEKRKPDNFKIQQQRSSSREECYKKISNIKKTQSSRDKETLNNKSTMEKQKKVAPRKKILKRSSKVEIETPLDNTEANDVTKLSSDVNQEDDKIKVTNNGTVKKTKPILKRSDHFEISVDKNSVLRKSESVKKVLHKDANLNLKGKLLQIQPFNDISFDNSFKPVHVHR